MPYPKLLLNDGVEVALDLRPHWWYFSKHIFSGVPLLVLLVLIPLNFIVSRQYPWWLWALIAWMPLVVMKIV